jgi:hypothetical protein
MKKAIKQSIAASHRPQRIAEENGFALVEFLISSIVVLIMSGGIFMMLTDVQSTSGYQSEVLSVMENTRVAMRALEHYIVQTGNNPKGATFAPITITDATKVQLCSDLTGSAGGDQGDPDGDILDAEEDVTIQYIGANTDPDKAYTIEFVTKDGTQTLARGITSLNMEYLDANGNSTTTAADIRKIRVTITGSSAKPNPRTHKTFGITLNGDFTLPNQG